MGEPLLCMWQCTCKGRHMNTHTHTDTDRQTQTHTHTRRHTHKQTDTHTHTHKKCLCTCFLITVVSITPVYRNWIMTLSSWKWLRLLRSLGLIHLHCEAECMDHLSRGYLTKWGVPASSCDTRSLREYCEISRYYHSVAYGHKLFTTKYAPTVRDFLAVKVPLDESGVFDLLCCEVANPTWHVQDT